MFDGKPFVGSYLRRSPIANINSQFIKVLIRVTFTGAVAVGNYFVYYYAQCISGTGFIAGEVGERAVTAPISPAGS